MKSLVQAVKLNLGPELLNDTMDASILVYKPPNLSSDASCLPGEKATWSADKQGRNLEPLRHRHEHFNSFTTFHYYL
jgi:hypothetical protein